MQVIQIDSEKIFPARYDFCTREYNERSEGLMMDQFEQVWKQYEPMVSAIIRKLHIYRDFESFRQTAAIALWQAWLRYEEERGAFAPFAYRSMYGAMLDDLKKETKVNEKTVGGGGDLLEEFAVEESVEDHLPDWLDRCQLSQQEQRLLKSLFIDGVSVAELAQGSSLTLAGMKKRRERLLNKIRKELENNCSRSM